MSWVLNFIAQAWNQRRELVRQVYASQRVALFFRRRVYPFFDAAFGAWIADSTSHVRHREVQARAKLLWGPRVCNLRPEAQLRVGLYRAAVVASGAKAISKLGHGLGKSDIGGAVQRATLVVIKILETVSAWLRSLCGVRGNKTFLVF